MRDNSIVLLRFVAIICIVYHHSISSITGWPPIEIPQLTIYPIVLFSSTLAKNIGLVMFTFISGYLVFLSGKKLSPNYVRKKFKRVIIPCVLAAGIYFIIFPNLMYDNDPVNGTHLWYLPMIFIFYLFSPAITGNVLWKNALLVIGAFVFFKIGYFATNIRTFQECSTYWGVFVGGGIFCRLFAQYKLQASYSLLLIILLVIQDTRLNSFVTVFIICCLVFTLTKSIMPSAGLWNKVIVVVSDTSFEIYIFHQFIINIVLLVSINNGVNLYIVPPLSFVISLTLLPTIVYLVNKGIKNENINLG